jgi:phage shock protein PspC (stress-responsive transcriptional regulator)
MNDDREYIEFWIGLLVAAITGICAYAILWLIFGGPHG